MKKTFSLQVDGLTIAGQLFLPEAWDKPPYHTVCICHGISSGVRDPDDKGYPAVAEKFSGEGLAAAIFNFRGIGASGGNFDILGWTRDLKAVLDYLWTLPEVDKSRFSLVGFSAGAAVSVCVAATDKRVSSVVACACPAEFSSITESDNPQATIDYFRQLGIIRDAGFPQSVEVWLDGFRAVSPARSVAGIAPRPLLLVHGRHDKVVPVSSASALFDKAGEPKQLIIIETGEHRLRRNDAVLAIIIRWLKARG